jgi:hypothetical protein
MRYAPTITSATAATSAPTTRAMDAFRFLFMGGSFSQVIGHGAASPGSSHHARRAHCGQAVIGR